MRVITFFRMDMLTGKILEEVSHEYSGPVAELKKGREEMSQITHDDQGVAKTWGQYQNQYKNEADPFAKSLLATKPGELSPYAKAQYGSDIRNIHDTYGNLTRAGLAGLSYRGMGGAPTGMQASIINSGNRNEGAAETEAYNRALQSTLGQGLEGIRYAQGQQELYNPMQPQGQAMQAAYQRSQMGSTLGDIGAGITTLSNAALSGAKAAAL